MPRTTAPAPALPARVADRLQATRDRVAVLKAEITRVEQLPVDQATALERLARLLPAADPLDSLTRSEAFGGGAFEGPEITTLANRGLQSTAPDAAFRLANVIFGPTGLRGLIEDRVAGLYAPGGPLHGVDTISPAARKTRLAELRAELLEVEREEEAAVEMLEAEGVPVIRRPDADPRAVLGI